MKRAAAILAIFATSASATLTISLTSAVQNAARGTERVVSGTLTNTSATQKVFLNDLHATMSGGAVVHLALRSNDFFANVPGILLPGESYTGPIFRVALGAAAPADDYEGTITLDGGADIYATTRLAAATFTILSPEVNVVATDPSASEFGPDSGALQISRTGRTDIALAVPGSIAGSATNGTTYQSISPALTIPANASSIPVTITPIPDNIAQGDRLAILSLNPTTDHNLGLNITAAVTIHDKPADAWRFANFGANANSPAAADGADWDFDGIKNVVEFALALEPKQPDAGALPSAFVSGGYLTLSYVPNSAATDVTYAVEASTDFATWSTSDVEFVSVANPSPPNRVTVRYNHPVSLTSRVFLRLSIARP